MPTDNAPAPAASVAAWERQDGEPEAAYEAFKGYVYQMPPRRLVHSSVKHGTAELSTLYNDWRWQERALAYDRHVQKVRDDERDALIRQDEKERTAAQISLLKGLEDVANREIAKLINDSKNTQVSGLVKVADLNKMVGQIILMRRLIHGESTENVTMAVDLKKLSVDELRELQRLQAKMAADDEGDA